MSEALIVSKKVHTAVFDSVRTSSYWFESLGAAGAREVHHGCLSGQVDQAVLQLSQSQRDDRFEPGNQRVKGIETDREKRAYAGCNI